MNDEQKAHLDTLIVALRGWISNLQAQQEKLEKYRNGTVMIDVASIQLIAKAQQNFAQAAKNIADAIEGAAARD